MLDEVIIKECDCTEETNGLVHCYIKHEVLNNSHKEQHLTDINSLISRLRIRHDITFFMYIPEQHVFTFVVKKDEHEKLLLVNEAIQTYKFYLSL